ncbi:MAG TPA: type II toxin-antitoxin system prevent-host-death family antitoxin [Acidobacteriota bacterium]|jgi:prevent-host-death family protein
MKKTTAKDLRQKTAALLEDVRKGQEVLITKRGKAVAILAPVNTIEEAVFKPIGFGLWKDRRDMKNVGKWLAEARKPRFGR